MDYGDKTSQPLVPLALPRALAYTLRIVPLYYYTIYTDLENNVRLRKKIDL